MFNSFAPLDILLFAVIAVVVLYRVYKTLGTQTDVEPSTKKAKPAKKSEQAEESSSAPRPLFVPDSQDTEGHDYAEIIALDPDFDEKSFLEGASIAFDMISIAYATGDTKTLKSLLSSELFDDFCADIKEAKKLQHSTELEIIGINNMQIASVDIDGTVITLEVIIDSEQMLTVYDAEKNLIEGDAEELIDVRDTWSFQRDTQSQNPNWSLVMVNYEE